MNSSGAFQAVRDSLANYSPLASMVTYIGPDVAQPIAAEDAAQFPYTVIEEANLQPFDTKTDEGGDAIFQISTICINTPQKSAYQMASETAQHVYDALHNRQLKISGSGFVLCQFQGAVGVLQSENGKKRFRPMRFRVLYFQ